MTRDDIRAAITAILDEIGYIVIQRTDSDKEEEINMLVNLLHQKLVGDNIPLMLTADEGIIFMTIGALGMAYCMSHPTDRHLFNVARAINHYGESTFESMKQKAIAYSYELEGKPQPAETL